MSNSNSVPLAAAEHTPSQTDASTDACDRIFVFFKEETRNIRCQRGDSLVVGRSDDSDIAIVEPAVSRRHAIIRLGDRVEIEDVGSANGTFVDGVRLRERVAIELLPGALVRIGRAELIVFRPPQEQPFGRLLPVIATEGAGARDPMNAVHELCVGLARTDVAVLITGETGTGKFRVAAAIHERSRRAAMPLIHIDCAALGAERLEADLFGEGGALWNAEGGTLVLDEVATLSPSAQGRLLEALDRATPPDVRLVSITNHAPDSLVRDDRFRADLFVRLAAATVRVPPLRDRPAAISLLAGRFVEEAVGRGGPRRRLSSGALAALVRHPWPGNVRELRNAVTQAVHVAKGDVIEGRDLGLVAEPRLVAAATPCALAPGGSSSGEEGLPTWPPEAESGTRVRRDALLRDEIGSLERAKILAALRATGGNQALAAERVGISRRTLASRLDDYGMPRPRKPAPSRG